MDPTLDPPLRLRDTPITLALIGLCAALFTISVILTLRDSSEPWSEVLLTSLWSLDPDSGVLPRLGALELTRVWLDHEWWRLLTAAFLHGSWLHLLLNLSALWSVGTWVEHGLGGARTFFLFVLSALAASLASLLWCEAALVVGASGGILGLAGALWLLRRRAPPAIRARIADVSATNLGLLILLCLLLGLIVPLIAQAGHLGGLLGGLLLAALLLLPRPWSPLLAALSFVLALGLAQLASAPISRPNYHLFLAFRHLDDGASALALLHFEEALRRQPEAPELANAVAYQLALAGQHLDRADTLVDQALAAQPNNADYLDTKGWIACRRGDSEHGLFWLQRARENATTLSDEIRDHLETCEAVATGDVSRGTSEP